MINISNELKTVLDQLRTLTDPVLVDLDLNEKGYLVATIIPEDEPLFVYYKPEQLLTNQSNLTLIENRLKAFQAGKNIHLPNASNHFWFNFTKWKSTDFTTKSDEPYAMNLHDTLTKLNDLDWNASYMHPSGERLPVIYARSDDNSLLYNVEVNDHYRLSEMTAYKVGKPYIEVDLSQLDLNIVSSSSDDLTAHLNQLFTHYKKEMNK